MLVRPKQAFISTAGGIPGGVVLSPVDILRDDNVHVRTNPDMFEPVRVTVGEPDGIEQATSAARGAALPVKTPPNTPKGNGKVAVGFCYAQSTQTPQWRRSYTMVCLRDAATKRRIVGEFCHETSGAHIPTARNKIVREFLAHPQRPEWLWMVDTDATFADDVLERLIASAHPKERPIVGALAFGVRIAQDENGREVFNSVGAASLGLFPTIYVYRGDETGCVINYPKDQLVHCHATGAHCIIIHRSVLEDPRWLDDGHPLPWYRMSVRAGSEVSEDQFFCMKAGSMGYPVYVDTAIKTGHVKTFVADEDLFLAQS